jgi:hypothetical protein
MLISSTLSKGPKRRYGSSNRRKSLVNIPMRPRNSFQGRMQRMVEYCVRSDAIFWYHGSIDLDEADSLSLATRTSRIARAFHSRIPIPSRGCGDIPGVSAQPYLIMQSSPHTFKFNSPVTSIHHSGASALFNYPLAPPFPTSSQRQHRGSCTTTIPTTKRSRCHVLKHMDQVTIHYLLSYLLLGI